MNLLKNLSTRKFVFAMSALAAATGLIAFQLISDGVYSTIVLGIGGLFMSANVIEKKNAAA